MNVGFRAVTVLSIAAFSGGCSGALRTPPAIVNSPAASAPPVTAQALPATSLTAPLPVAVQAFEQEHLTGAMALFDTRDNKLACSDATRCDRGYLPASTFKIANTVIALETGVLSDAESPLPWDGKQYDNPDWNRDHTLRTAIQVSCLPCFRSVARKVGDVRMHDWVNRLDYGNRDVSGPSDLFWLAGAGIWYWGVWVFAMATWLPLVTRIRNIAEHACTSTGEDPFSHARTTHANPIERLFIAPYWVNYHAEHHLFMYLPCYRLPQAHRLLIEKGLITRMEVRPGYREVMRLATSSEQA